jgi:glyoxylase-like metal-dependent hydrolase (beta-lactamase superfamily II)
MQVKEYFDQVSNTFTYLVWDENSKETLIIDPVLDYDSTHSKVSYESIDSIAKDITDNGLSPKYIFDTHVHADHLSAAYELQQRYPKAKIGISHEILKILETFIPVFNSPDIKSDGTDFDILFKDGESFNIGELKIDIIGTPGHTPACTCFKIGDTIFTGDALFMPDFGTGRCDFPAGSAKDLFNSISTKLYGLDPKTKVLVGHDYGSGGREIKNKTSIGECMETSVQLKADTSEAQFLDFRVERDKKLSPPKLLMQSLQVNLRAGRLPELDAGGSRFFKIPLGN